MEKPMITVATPTYNRKDKLPRVYESLKKQTYRNFEWIIIDDGSEDNTKELVEKWIQENPFPISYYCQEHAGKHVAINKVLEIATGEYFTSIDSDNEIKPESLEILINEWNKIPEDKRKMYSSVTARSYNPENNELIGEPFTKKMGKTLDCSSLDARYKYKMHYERWGLARTEAVKEFTSPVIDGKFYPETIMQDKCARKYIERYIDIPLSGYYKDTNNAITKTKLIKENFYLWQHNINDNMDYFFYDIPNFLKSFVGVSMTGFANDMKAKEIIASGNSIMKKIGITIFMPAGYILYRKYR
jgi:glycosyltransferase involved in cell wall biosynthesis